MYIEPIDEPILNTETNEKWIKINISNQSIKLINEALSAYKGDEDEDKVFKKQLRHDVLAIRNILNPS